MTFNPLNSYRLYGYQTLLSIVLFLLMSSSYAQVSVNNIEKNDKVTGSAVTQQTTDNKISNKEDRKSTRLNSSHT